MRSYYGPYLNGKRIHKTSPNSHFPVNDCKGVKGTANKHIKTSENAKFNMNKFVTVCMCFLLITT